MGHHSALAAYLDVLTGAGRGEGWLELRYRYPGGMRTRFYPARGPHGPLSRIVERTGPVTDVYVGCALRSSQHGDRAHVGQVWTLWAECDGEDARPRLDALPLVPSLVIASGTPGNVHAYWALKVPTDADRAEGANQRLAAAVGGDPVCFDAARILRPPGTQNHKHAPPTPVQLVASSSRLPLAIGDIERELPAAIEPPLRGRTGRASPDPLLDVPPVQYVTALLGTSLNRDHKATCPFHEDRTPSLHAYPTAERGWFCFGCRRGGSIYDLAAQLWSIEPRGAGFIELRARLSEVVGTAGTVRSVPNVPSAR